jgi:ornithine cyclodeaminase
MDQIPQITSSFINNHTHYPDLIQALRKGFSEDNTYLPARHHHSLPTPDANTESTLLLMPAWNSPIDGGVKIITVNPQNHKFGVPSINGAYLYFDATLGTLKALFDAKELTTKRTTAASALASSYLSRSDSSVLMMVGTGALAKDLILAHASVRPIKQVFIWGRDYQKAKNLSQQFEEQDFAVEAITNIKENVSKADIISCATLSSTPLIMGEYLSPGQHLDLVGAFKPETRESDDQCIQRSSVFVDTFQGAQESGDLVIPMSKGLISIEDIKADLFGLCAGTFPGRDSEIEITLFKSVGHALEDLVAARYYYNQLTHE